MLSCCEATAAAALPVLLLLVVVVAVMTVPVFLRATPSDGWQVGGLLLFNSKACKACKDSLLFDESVAL
jgi:hypothetical protein